ncbi:hypothetical protein BDA96_05G028400 [Sorghum bicolor]|uniref:Uncharacterized protein n=1 Tax=Sorghum bicolor TaxID=4558 RepID=A0A921QVS9_SORBI|nr:hypothetical protein BDA96_05G028400 [Sorghum bicolor]KAG0528634.1 hypothetical protein BDA96_05G028400 [Sorghum bicolor]
MKPKCILGSSQSMNLLKISKKKLSRLEKPWMWKGGNKLYAFVNFRIKKLPLDIKGHQVEQ